VDRSLLTRFLPGTARDRAALAAVALAWLAGCSGSGSPADVAPQPSGTAATTALSATSAPNAASSAPSAAPSDTAAPLASASASASASATPSPGDTASPAPAGTGPLTVAELVAHPPASGSVTILAYVLYVYTCPPCPPGAMCKVCFPDSLQLGDAPKLVATAPNVFPPTARVLLGDVPDPKPTVGKRYRIEAVVVPHGADAHDLKAVKITPAP
jgi:hypothetical protein